MKEIMKWGKERISWKELAFVSLLLGALTVYQVWQAPAFVSEHYFEASAALHLSALVIVVGASILLDRYLFRFSFGCRFMKVAVMRTIMYGGISAALSIATVTWYGTVVENFNTTAYYFGNWLFYALAFLGTNVIMEVSKLAGTGFLDKLILGRYHRPRKEHRIFLFIDLKESTKLSKELPLERYSMLLKEFFRDIDTAAEQHSGEIYQYAGDQVIISWPASPLNYEKAVNAFLKFFDGMKTRRAHYIKQYGVVPRYKAAMHSGEVVGTWVGRTKRELVFQGEILNIAARITGLAKNLSYPILITREIVDKLNEDLRQLVVKGGSFSIKGLEEPVMVYFLETGNTAAVRIDKPEILMEEMENLLAG